MAQSLGFYRSPRDFWCTILGIHPLPLVLLTHWAELKASLSLTTPTVSSSKKKEEEIVQTHLEIDMEPVLALDFYIKDILHPISRTIIFETY
ncbi:general transcription factor 3C polypeptide [Trifolium repens]|nr:general transcription factor 3C polypeptide [Trifolium repens]